MGRPDAAAAAKLYTIAGGTPDAVTACMPLFEAMGQRTYHLTEQPPTANLIKLTYNFLIASVMEALGEAMALIGKAGVGKREFLDLLTSTSFNAPIYKTYGGLIADRKFQPAGFAALLGLKDISLVQAAADEIRVPLPLASLVHERTVALLASGGEELDWSAIALMAARDAGE